MHVCVKMHDVRNVRQVGNVQQAEYAAAGAQRPHIRAKRKKSFLISQKFRQNEADF